MPHKPLAASEMYYKQSGAGLYGDVMAELDASVGQVLDKLKELKPRREHAGHFHQRQRPLVRRQHGRVARHEGHQLGGRLSRAVPRALAG